MKKILAFNWKENPIRERDALTLFKKTITRVPPGVQLIVCPPFIHLEAVARKSKLPGFSTKHLLGAQDVFWENKGAFTSEVGPRMLYSIGVRYVIIGHSERRKLLGETDALINKKIKAALLNRLNVILCVGESKSVRSKGFSTAQRFVKAQLQKDLKDVSRLGSAQRIMIAYEPLWAIGSGKNDAPDDAAHMIGFIRASVKKMYPSLSITCLYGGSVTGKNIADYLNFKGVDGALIGGASLDPLEVRRIVQKVA